MTVAMSVAERLPSVAFRVKINFISDSTEGALNVTVCAAASSRDTFWLAGEVWTHRYVTEPCGAPAALPESVTESPSRAATMDSA